MINKLPYDIVTICCMAFPFLILIFIPVFMIVRNKIIGKTRIKLLWKIFTYNNNNLESSISYDIIMDYDKSLNRIWLWTQKSMIKDKDINGKNYIAYKKLFPE